MTPVCHHTIPELSIVVPLLNELDQLPGFFADLRRQEAVDFDLLICDGGSCDGSLEWLRQQQPEWAGLRICPGKPGRGRQLNQGAANARADWLLFLHVDSRFSDPQALRRSLDFLTRTESRLVAGHFALKFRRIDAAPSAGYYFYEWKARLGRPETIHGDQGFMLSRELFRRVGPFREDLPAMEDTDFAERLRDCGQWQLLPAEISTSARRFETEGLWQRQLLGALMMCFRTVGWDDFFTLATGVYRQQADTEKLQLLPFFNLVSRQLKAASRRTRWRIWTACGEYVRTHAWQLFFALDARRAFRKKMPVGTGQTAWLDFFEPLFDLLTANLLGRYLAAIALRIWFASTSLWLQRRERNTS